MKKLFIGLLLVCLFVSGCGSVQPQSWDKQIVGSWRILEGNDNQPLIYSYSADGTFSAKATGADFKGFWKIVDNERRHIKSWSNAFGDTEQTATTFEVTIDGDKSQLRDVKDNMIMKLIRVSDSDKP